jgi:hypothetical protein
MEVFNKFVFGKVPDSFLVCSLDFDLQKSLLIDLLNMVIFFSASLQGHLKKEGCDFLVLIN